MVWLKNIFLVFMCVILGIALGGGIFLLQNRYLPRSTSESSKKTETSPTPASSMYKGDLASFTLPKKVAVLEEVVESKITQLSLLSNASDTSLQSTGVKIFLSSKSGLATAALTSQRTALKKRALSGLTLDSTKPVASSTIGGPVYYTNSNGASIAVYEPENTTALVVLLHDTSAPSQLSLNDFNLIITALSTGKTPTTPSTASPSSPSSTSTPTTGTASPLLNMTL